MKRVIHRNITYVEKMQWNVAMECYYNARANTSVAIVVNIADFLHPTVYTYYYLLFE